MKRLELDKMLEQSPSIPEYIINIYNEKTENLGTNLHKPEIANILQTIQPFKSHDSLRNVNRHTKEDFKLMYKYFLKWRCKQDKNHKTKKTRNPYLINLPKKIKYKPSFFRNKTEHSKHSEFVIEVANSYVSQEELEFNKILTNNENIENDHNYGFASKLTPKLSSNQNIKLNTKNTIGKFKPNRNKHLRSCNDDYGNHNNNENIILVEPDHADVSVIIEDS